MPKGAGHPPAWITIVPCDFTSRKINIDTSIIASVPDTAVMKLQRLPAGISRSRIIIASGSIMGSTISIFSICFL
jgi:hypothetical protein